jgi:hypothetical protein
MRLCNNSDESSYAEYVNFLVENISTIKKNTEGPLHTSKEFALEVNAWKNKFCIYPCLVFRLQDKIII